MGGEKNVLKVIVKMKHMIEKDHIAWIELLQKGNGSKVQGKKDMIDHLKYLSKNEHQN